MWQNTVRNITQHQFVVAVSRSLEMISEKSFGILCLLYLYLYKQAKYRRRLPSGKGLCFGLEIWYLLGRFPSDCFHSDHVVLRQMHWVLENVDHPFRLLHHPLLQKKLPSFSLRVRKKLRFHCQGSCCSETRVETNRRCPAQLIWKFENIC